MCIKIKRVVHGTCGVMIGNIQGAEVVVIVLDLGAFLNGESQRLEQLFDATQGVRDRVQATLCLSTPRQANVDGLACQLCIQRG